MGIGPGRAPAGSTGAGRGSARAGLAGQDVGRADEDAVHPGGCRRRQRRGDVRRRPRRLALARGRRSPDRSRPNASCATARCSARPHPASRSAPTWPAGQRPPSRSPPRSRRILRRPGVTSRRPRRSTRRRRPRMSGSWSRRCRSPSIRRRPGVTTSSWARPSSPSPRRRLGDPRAGAWLKQAGYWATQYIAHEAGGDTLNLYDVSALAHADLIKAARRDRPLVRQAGRRSAGAVADRRGPGVGGSVPGGSAVRQLRRRTACVRPGRDRAAVPEGDRRPTVRRLRQPATRLELRRERVGCVVHGRRRAERRALPASPDREHHRERELTGAVVNGPNSAELFEEGSAITSTG